MNITIGEKIKDLRRFHGITQNALAAYLGVSSQSVSKWENDVSMPDLSIIPGIASYFGITIDELFSFTPNRSREMQIELYVHALYHFVEMATYVMRNGILALESWDNGYIHRHELNPLIHEGILMMCEGVKPEIITLYLKTKGKNEHINFDENYVDCIVTGINNIYYGVNQHTVYHLAAAYVPKNIFKEVSHKFHETCRVNIEKNRKILCNQTVKTDLLEFIAELSDEVIKERIIRKVIYEKKEVTLIYAMRSASGEVNKRIMQLIIPENDHEKLADVLSREWKSSYGLSKFIYYFMWSDLLYNSWEGGICKSQQEILEIYNQMDK
jgi:transcriptional regulator with XRE-family HTH domain